MNNCKPLGEATKLLIPDFFDDICWGNIWNRKLESGTAFEWTITAAIIHAARSYGFSVSIPLIETFHAPDYYVLRNEIPLTHGAQAGNSDSILRSKPLAERFLYCLVPKAIFEKNGKYYSLFREGCPYHKIMSGQAYRERTDIIIVPGKPHEGYPAQVDSKNDIIFVYDYDNQSIEGCLVAKNSPFIPVKRRNPKGGVAILAKGIIECSVNKTSEIASEQLSRYKALFRVGKDIPRFSLVTGNDLSHLPYDTHTINLSTMESSRIAEESKIVAKKIIDYFFL